MSSETPELWLELKGGRKGYLPGEQVHVSALWALPAAPAMLEARLCWYTRGKGTEDVQILAVERPHQITAAGEAVFSFPLPEEPYSFSGKLISIIWAVELVADSKSALCEFVMGPDGREVTVESLA
jgi:hypothetical protein